MSNGFVGIGSKSYRPEASKISTMYSKSSWTSVWTKIGVRSASRSASSCANSSVTRRRLMCRFFIHGSGWKMETLWIGPGKDGIRRLCWKFMFAWMKAMFRSFRTSASSLASSSTLCRISTPTKFIRPSASAATAFKYLPRAQPNVQVDRQLGLRKARCPIGQGNGFAIPLRQRIHMLTHSLGRDGPDFHACVAGHGAKESCATWESLERASSHRSQAHCHPESPSS